MNCGYLEEKQVLALSSEFAVISNKSVQLLFFLAFDFEMCFASHSVSNMLRRVTAQQALLRLQGISADCSDGEYSDSELDDAQAELDSSGEKSDVDTPSENDDSNLQNQVQVNQDLIKKDGTAWQVLAISHVQ